MQRHAWRVLALLRLLLLGGRLDDGIDCCPLLFGEAGHNLIAAAFAVAVAILAGLGSLYAVVVAGLIVGIAMDVSVFWIPAGYRPLIAFGVVILVLLFRPEGLAGKKS